MTSNNKNLLHFANKFADISRDILKKKYLKSFKVQEKPDGSFVTNIDKEIELIFRENLKKKIS